MFIFWFSLYIFNVKFYCLYSKFFGIFKVKERKRGFWKVYGYINGEIVNSYFMLVLVVFVIKINN